MVYFFAFLFGYTSYQSRARGSRASRLSSSTMDKHSEKWLALYANDPEVYSVTTYSLSEN